MEFKIVTNTHKIASLKKRIRAIQGGTSSSKTISILIGLIEYAQKDTSPTLTSVVSESMPHLKKGCIRDFKNILRAHGYWKTNSWAETDKVYTFPNGSQIEFFGADQADKLRGGRRDRLFINECNNVSFAAFEEMEVRTREFVYLDWNPVSEFWFDQEVKNVRDDVDFLVVNYLGNEALDPETIASIEQRKNRKGWWMVYGLGLLGEIEGKIYKGWEIIDEIPQGARLERRWLDYGYSNDPTAVGDIYKWNDSYILDEILYQKGLSNKQIADVILNQDIQIPVAADSAEPKSNDELVMYGITILPAHKGKDSVNNGIQIVQQQKIFVTKRSVNIIKEYRNYLWEVDKNSKVINVPSPLFNHHMDGIRYGFESLIDFLPNSMLREQEEMFTRNRYRQTLNSAK